MSHHTTHSLLKICGWTFSRQTARHGRTVQLLPLSDCSLNLYTLSKKINLTRSICSLCKILCTSGFGNNFSALLIQKTTYNLCSDPHFWYLLQKYHFGVKQHFLFDVFSLKSTLAAAICTLRYCQSSFPCNYFMNSKMCWLEEKNSLPLDGYAD